MIKIYFVSGMKNTQNIFTVTTMTAGYSFYTRQARSNYTGHSIVTYYQCVHCNRWTRNRLEIPYAMTRDNPTRADIDAIVANTSVRRRAVADPHQCTAAAGNNQ